MSLTVPAFSSLSDIGKRYIHPRSASLDTLLMITKEGKTGANSAVISGDTRDGKTQLNSSVSGVRAEI
jgi:hypothetical protein